MTEKKQNIPTDQEVRQWLYATSKGDQSSFTLLLRSFWSKVYVQALTYLKSPEQAQEITQDVFIKLWSVKEKLVEVENFSDYLFILSRNEIISALRKKKIPASAPSDQIEEMLLRPDRQLHYKESYTQLLRLIDELPPTRKKVFTLSRMEGRSYEEIGALLGISRNGVKDHIVKALNYLRTHFRLDPEKLLILICAVLLLR